MHGRILTSLVVLAAASNVNASIFFSAPLVDNSAALTGYTTFDLQVTTDTDWTGAVFLVELSAGDIYQHPFGTTAPPQPFAVALFPELEFDTYVIGSVAGGAGDVGGDGFTFNDTELDVSWYNTSAGDTGTTTIGRLTISNDAVWSWALALTAENQSTVNLGGTVGQSSQATAGGGTEGLTITDTTDVITVATTGLGIKALLGQPYATAYATPVSSDGEPIRVKLYEPPSSADLPEPASIALSGILVAGFIARRSR